MKRIPVPRLVVVFVLGLAAVAFAAAERALVIPVADHAWQQGAIPGVRTAVVEGRLDRGSSRFFLEYPAGFVTPLHHHTADHDVVLVSGTLVLKVGDKEHRLEPGSFFALLGRAKHVARCESATPCVMFVDARRAWDVVPDPEPATAGAATAG